MLSRALELSLALDVSNDEAGGWLAGGRASALVALELWDVESSHALAAIQAQIARDTGAFVHLQYALNFLASAHLFAGELTTAARLIDKDCLIAEVTGNPPGGYAAMALAAWQGSGGAGVGADQGHLGSGDRTRPGQDAHLRGLRELGARQRPRSSRRGAQRAWRAFERDDFGHGPNVVLELAEAASRTGDEALVRAALQWLSERTRLAPSEWALGRSASIELTWLCASHRSVLRLKLDPA